MKQDSASGAIVRSDQAAFVIDADGRVSLLLPAKDPGAPLAPGHQLLLAIFARLNDPDWVDNLLHGERGQGRKLGFF